MGDKKKRKSYLIGIIDDATRLVPYASLALNENTASYLPVLEEAVLRRGVPKRLYVDNGSVFRTHHLAVVCARLRRAGSRHASTSSSGASRCLASSMPSNSGCDVGTVVHCKSVACLQLVLTR